MIIEGDINNWSEWQEHTYGTCLAADDLELMYVNIPKNASEWTKSRLMEHNWSVGNYRHDNLLKTAIVVLRDPVARWKSGIVEYLIRNGTAEPFEDIFDKIVYDEHTAKQVNFIHGLDTDKCIFFMADNTYRHKFSDYLNQYIPNNRFYEAEFENVSATAESKQHLIKMFDQALQNSKYQNQIKEYFKQDYTLINQVKFYDPRQLNI